MAVFILKWDPDYQEWILTKMNMSTDFELRQKFTI